MISPCGVFNFVGFVGGVARSVNENNVVRFLVLCVIDYLPEVSRVG